MIGVFWLQLYTSIRRVIQVVYSKLVIFPNQETHACENDYIIECSKSQLSPNRTIARREGGSVARGEKDDESVAG
jgi:hypothetical protein